MTDHLDTWRALVSSDNLPAAVREHLAFLAGTDEHRGLLDELIGRLVRAEIDGDSLDLVFQYVEYPDEECVVSCSAPYDGDTGAAPPSVTDVVRVHNGMGWEGLGGGGFGFYGFRDGAFLGGGGWESVALEEAADENAVFLEQLREAGLTADDVESPFEYGQNWLIWHPAEENQLGEPAVYFVSHGDCVATPVKAARDLPFGPLMLSIMAQDILGKEILDSVYT